MKKTNLIYGTLLIVFIMMCCSCGSRKVNKSHSKEETKSETKDNTVTDKQSETNVKTITTTITDDKNESVTEETIYKPEDSSKEAYIIEKDGTKTVLNNVSKTVKKTTQKNNTKSQTFGNSELVQTEAVKEQKNIIQVNTSKEENKSKEVEKEGFNWFSLFWIIGLTVFLGITIYRIYKKLPLVPKI